MRKSKERVNDNFKLCNNNFKNRFFHPYDERSFIKHLFGYCNCPAHGNHWFIYPKVIRMNTSYKDEKSNWIVCCENFYNDVVTPYWEAMWSDYYS